MLPIICGCIAAITWGITNTISANAARGLTARQFGLIFQATQALAVLVPAAFVFDAKEVSVHTLVLVLVAGGSQAAGLVTFRRALKLEQVGVVAPLAALEGAVMAIVSIIGGEAVPTPTAVGLGLAVTGGWIVGAAPRSLRLNAGSAYALVTAALFGTALWLLAVSGFQTLSALAIFNGVAAAAFFAPGTPDSPRATRLGTAAVVPGGYAVVAGLGSVAGQIAFVNGARAGGGAITGVLSAQSMVIAVLGGLALFGERLALRQVVGITLLLAGISLVSAASG